ncbi:G patch domain-containing protein 3-like [Limulus polyphemus]|uniref:G patch domain-containing protein 3-like n=1 Tax=Limulus polyphemus TaxID=6850 RepID=A0ABM1B4P4_LIMPO|nr:G patch domain-containing protein 3-like [Limulus polyphemus]
MVFSYIYAVVNNIPFVYHSSDLRNFFSQFVETNGFECFHFRHRPEIQKRQYRMDSGSFTNSSRPKVTSNDPNATNSNNTSTSTVNSDAAYEFYTAGPNFTETRSTISSCTTSNTSNLTCCCVVKVRSSRFQELMKLYHRKHWIDRNGYTLPIRCFISRVKLSDENLEQGSVTDIATSDVERSICFSGTCSGNEEESNKLYKTRAEERAIPVDRECFSVKDLHKLKEFHPPPVMPHGNVGTPTRIFLDLIRSCQLPPSIITKLGLEFPKTRCKRIYGSVPFEYDTQFYKDRGVSHENDDFEPARTAKGDVITEIVSSSMSMNKKDIEVREVEKTSDRESEEDDDMCEEWERHEALHNDVTQQERSKERLFEEEIELKWEKGGSGLVFYTDAQYWDAKEGDFDEKTADDWDVDMAGYYEPGAGDKDALDFLQMRRETRLRNGIDDDDDETFNTKIGFFENHTKGIGRRLMEKQGWRDGQGLGKTVIGPAEPVVDKGQNPRNKSGFGYRGEKLVRRPGSRGRKRRQFRNVVISTAYDNPYKTDPIEPLLRSSLPSVLSFRKEFMKSSENQ